MTIKGKLKRPPCMRMDGAPIKAVRQAKVLGVVLDDVRSYGGHASAAGATAANFFGKVARVSTSSWGMGYPALRTVYAGTYIAILTYAAAVWCRRASMYVVKSVLLRTQRPALILLTKAYRSVSTAALPVLAGVLPADLEVLRAGRVEREGTGVRGRERGELKRIAWADAVALWQDRWESSGDGRELYSFFPNVATRLGSPWVQPDYIVSQMLTGHGHFRERLCRMTLCDTALCECGQENETRDHILWRCDAYREEREIMLQGLQLEEIGAAYHGTLVASDHNFRLFRCFAKAWHDRRALLD